MKSSFISRLICLLVCSGIFLQHASAISSCSELLAIPSTGTSTLTANIDCSATTITPVSGFAGVLDGQGYTISGIKISGITGNNIGLFTTSSGATIKNVVFSNFQVVAPGQTNVGLIFGQATNVQFNNVNLTSTGSTNNVCGKCAYHKKKHKKIINFLIPFLLQSQNKFFLAAVGGIAGAMSGGSFTNCFVGNTLVNSSSNNLGGFVGSVSTTAVTFQNCFQLGISGQTSALVAFLSSGYAVGGFVGLTNVDLTFSQCGFVQGKVVSPEGCCGGFLGSLSGGSLTFSQCYISSNVILSVSAGIQNVGGFVGSTVLSLPGSLSVSNSYSLAVIQGSPTMGYAANLIGTYGFQGASTISYSEHFFKFNPLNFPLINL